jgi:hypothetical protein
VGVFDYWSQTALKPLHDVLMDTLRGIKVDCTFDQTRFKKFVPTYGTFFSFDLSNATDRMPILLQKRLLSRIIGEEKVED